MPQLLSVIQSFPDAVEQLHAKANIGPELDSVAAERYENAAVANK